MTRPAIGCVRVSTEMQATQYGPERQRDDITLEAARHELDIVSWQEDAISGTNHERAADNAYFTLARQHHGMNFIFSHPNRVGRHVEVNASIVRQLHALGATVWIAGLGTLRDKRNWGYYLRDSVDAELDHANIVDQLVRGKRSKATAGRWPHGAPPWGYVLGRDRLGRAVLPEPGPHAAVVRRVADLSETMGETLTARLMAAEGHPTAGGGPWTARVVSNILRNERYSGRAVFQGIELQFEPIIPREQWERIQQRRAVRVRESGPRDTSLLWAGHVRCAVCGSAIGRDAHKTKYATYTYYRCWRARRSAAQRAGGTEPCTNTRNWPIQASEQAWWEHLVAHLTDPALLAEIVAPAPEAPVSPPPARIAELETAITRAWEPFAAGHVSAAVAERLAAPYTAELERLRLEYAPRPPEPGPDLVAAAAGFMAALPADMPFEDRREVLAAVDVRLYVGPDGVVRLSVNLP